MSLAAEFTELVAALPDDWTDLELDLRIDNEDDYIEAATLLTQCNAQPYSRHDWHWRLLIANNFGHAAAVEAVHATFGLLDANTIKGEFAVRKVRSGRVETVQMWGRPEAVRREFRARRAQ